MAEPAAIWSPRQITTNKTISLTQNVILSYARDALNTVIARIELVHTITKLLPGQNFSVGPDLPSLLTDITLHQGIASLLLFNDGRRGHRETEAAYASRTERIAYVANRCSHLELPNLKSRVTRNALTHLDEYLVGELAADNTGWCIDMAVKSRSEFVPKRPIQIAFCRSYIIDEDKLLNFGNEIRLSDLKSECEQVLALVWPTTDVSYYSGPLYDVKVGTQTFSSRLIEWGIRPIAPNGLAGMKDTFINYARDLLRLFRRRG